MPRLRCPIHPDYLKQRRIAEVTLLYGAESWPYSQKSPHKGLDFRTKGVLKYNYHNIIKYVMSRRGYNEKIGMIPIVAMHDGFLNHDFNNSYPDGVFANLISTDGTYATKYLHLSKLRVWKDDGHRTAHEKINGNNFVKAGTILGWGGDSGPFCFGAHSHVYFFTIDQNGWHFANPMPHLKDDIIYETVYGNKRYFYHGKEINKLAKEDILKRLK